MSSRIINNNPHTMKEHAENWRQLGSPVNGEVPAGDVDGANVDFILANRALPNSLKVYYGPGDTALLRIASSAYTESIDGTTNTTKITFSSPPDPGVLIVDYRVR